MPTATLTFQLPEEQSEFESACQAGVWEAVCWDLDQQVLRSALKHGHDHKSADDAVEHSAPPAEIAVRFAE